MALLAPSVFTRDLDGIHLAISFSIAVGTAGLSLMVGDRSPEHSSPAREGDTIIRRRPVP